jgi:hypothetical protein
MRTRSWIFAVLVSVNLISWSGVRSASAAVDIQFSAGLEIQSTADFYQPLADYGEWVDVPRYGRCWHPAQVETEWRPYADGHWEWTDCGWYWVSDEPWSWACYHYGGWNYDSTYGWIWIPATEWAPAWVTWRESPDYDYIGWAPCGPGGAVLAPSLFVFVDTRHFSQPIRSRNLIVNNTTIINRTRVVNNFQRETRDFGGRRERVVVNRGHSVDRIQKTSGTTFRATPVTQVVSQTAAPEAIRRRSDSGITRPVLHEQPRTQRGNQNEHSARPAASANDSQLQNQRRNAQVPNGSVSPAQRSSESSINDRRVTPNTIPGSSPRPLEPTGRQQPSGVRTKPNNSYEKSTSPSEHSLPNTRRHETGRSQPLSEHPSSSGTLRTSDQPDQPTVPHEAIPGTTPKPSAPPTAAPGRSALEPTGREHQPSSRTQPMDRPTSASGTREQRLQSEPSDRPSVRSSDRPSQATPPRESIPGASPRPSSPPPSAPAPSSRPTTPEPTGREHSRVYEPNSATHPQASSPAPRPEVVTPRQEAHQSLPASVREKPLEPTGRETQAPRQYEAPAQRPEPRVSPSVEQPHHKQGRPEDAPN